MSLPVTLADVARAAGISRYTVMLAFVSRRTADPRRQVAGSTFERIMDAAERLDYRPERMARRGGWAVRKQRAADVPRGEEA